MSNVYYKLYRDSVLEFAKTLVIKCAGVAETINHELTALGVPVNPDRPDTWKYYMNLAGEYHETDELIYVRSLDTLEDIALTKENLAIHRATAREYKPGGVFHDSLMSSHPDKTPLIRGILFPVDKQTAIDADDGTLLYYDRNHIESNELSLVNDLQYWLTAFFARWHNPQYLLTDDLYLSSFLGTLYMQLPLVIQNLRIRRVKTPEAHSFHVREYLASNGGLDEFLPYLTKEQQLFLYRNLRYMNRNLGKQAIFDTLVNKLLTPRGIPLNWYKLEHNNSELPADVYPDVDAVQYPINHPLAQVEREYSTVHTILEKERGIARDNYTVERETEIAVTDAVRSGQYSQLPTKVLESTVVDRSNASIRSLMNVLLNQWVHMASTGRYRSYITVTHPVTDELISLSVKDAFILAYYLFHKARDLEVEEVPRVLAYMVLRERLPNFNELAALVDPRYVPDRLITAVMDRISPLGEYITVERFNDACATLHREYLKLWELYSFQENYLTRGMVEQVVRCHFKHDWCTLTDEPTTYDDWLDDLGLDLTLMATLDYEQLMLDCVNAATGVNLKNQMSFAEIQKAMLQLMQQMSSYSVQYLRTINNSDFVYVGTPAIRLGDIGGETRDGMTINQGRTTILHIHGKDRINYRIDKTHHNPPVDVDAKEKVRLRIPVNVGVAIRPQSIAYVPVDMATVRVRKVDINFDNNPPTDGNIS